MSQDTVFSKTELLRQMEEGWESFQNYIRTLNTQQLTIPTDEAGWTVKDHIMHLAVWEKGIDALLNKEPRGAAMGLEDSVWLSDNYDVMNAVIQQQHAAKSLDEVLRIFSEVHERVRAKIESMSEEDLKRPYREYQTDADRDEPVWGWIEGNTYEHYAEHQPWIADIANKAAAS